MKKEKFREMLEFQKRIFKNLPDMEEKDEMKPLVENILSSMKFADKYCDVVTDNERACLYRMVKGDLLDAMSVMFGQKKMKSQFNIDFHLQNHSDVEDLIKKIRKNITIGSMNEKNSNHKEMMKKNDVYFNAINQYSLYPNDENQKKVMETFDSLNETIDEFIELTKDITKPKKKKEDKLLN